MNPHPSDAQLAAFAVGLVEAEAAVWIAEHLDACAACGRRMEAADPLASAFQAVDAMPAPAPPPGLAARAVASAAGPAESGLALPIGVALLAAGLVLALPVTSLAGLASAAGGGMMLAMQALEAAHGPAVGAAVGSALGFWGAGTLGLSAIVSFWGVLYAEGRWS